MCGLNRKRMIKRRVNYLKFKISKLLKFNYVERLTVQFNSDFRY